MAEATPLTDEERAELEALRSEKKAREEAEAARKEREELERLRAEKAQIKDAAQAAPSPKQQTAANAAPVSAKPQQQSFGVKMVSSGALDKDDIPGMAPAQKIIIALAFVALIVFIVYIALSNAGML